MFMLQQGDNDGNNVIIKSSIRNWDPRHDDSIHENLRYNSIVNCVAGMHLF